jgi:Skp family chaperone for outer membrane proteins
MLVATLTVGVWLASTGLNDASAQGGPPGGTRVAVVNLVQVFNAYQQTLALNRALTAHREQLGQEAQKRKAAIDAQRVKRDAFNSDTKEWHRENKEYKRMRFDFGIWEAMEKDDVVTAHKEWIKRTYNAITAEVARVAKTRGIQLVLTSEDLEEETEDATVLMRQIFNRKVVYADSSIDISAEVLRNLDAAFEKAGGDKAIQFGDKEN